MSIFAEINEALETRLGSMSNVPDIAWPNITYSPEPDVMYLRPNNLPIDPVKIGVSDVDSFRRDGLYQIDVFSPKNAGAGAANSMAGSVYAHFPVGLELFTTTDSYKIRVEQVAVEVGELVGAHYVVPMLIRYSAITN